MARSSRVAVVAMRCPEDHRAADGPAARALVEEWAAATSWGNVITCLLAERRCPACPQRELAEHTRVLCGRERAAGTCPCCDATWLLDEPEGWTVLDTGSLET